MNEHDPDSIGLLVILGRGEGQPGSCGKQNAGQCPDPGDQGTGKAHEALRVSEAEHGRGLNRPGFTRQVSQGRTQEVWFTRMLASETGKA